MWSSNGHLAGSAIWSRIWRRASFKCFRRRSRITFAYALMVRGEIGQVRIANPGLTASKFLAAVTTRDASSCLACSSESENPSSLSANALIRLNASDLSICRLNVSTWTSAGAQDIGDSLASDMTLWSGVGQRHSLLVRGLTAHLENSCCSCSENCRSLTDCLKTPPGCVVKYFSAESRSAL
jgi:hypothetical protein